jgi:hypothetical protein
MSRGAKPRRACVEAAFALDEITQRLMGLFAFGSVPQHPRPFAPGSVIDPVMFGRA